jgi:hypothetical protein
VGGSAPNDDYLAAVDSDAEGWAESERERELMVLLVEAAHLRSAARAWYRRRGLLDDSTRRTGSVPVRRGGGLVR